MRYSTNAPEKRDFAEYWKIAEHYGAKVAGLSFLPQEWCPSYCALSASLYARWAEGNDIRNESELLELLEWILTNVYETTIIRSSGVHENIYDRGKYLSRVISAPLSIEILARAVEETFEHARKTDPNDKLALIVQEYKTPEFAGHLSNEYRVSPTVNQWRYELAKPQWTPSKGINSKLTTSPDPATRLRCGKHIPHQPLRSLAHYLAEHFLSRCHVEWLVSGGVLWVVQLDFEWKELENGCDPRRDLKSETPPSLDLERRDQLDYYRIGSETKWKKLQNLTDFDFDEDNPGPRIYELPPDLVVRALANTKETEKLVDEIVALTGGRLVVRTDCVQDDVGHFNLPRTDTVGAEQALAWCGETAAKFKEKGVKEQNFVFLFHAFLPSRSSAWAYAKPDNPMVLVDALWGLPDGLQVLPVDTYEVNVARNKIIETKSTYKPKFLTELEDGTWDYQSIRSRSARGRVLGKRDILEIATRTHKIAGRLGEEAQIMWFCEIPEGYRVGRHLPWFRSREKLDPDAPRQQGKFRPFSVSSPADLSRLPTESVTLKLAPEANLIRDEAFLNQVIEVARQRGLPVELEGSILGHAYYRLSQEQIPVILANEPKYYRQRQRQAFGKIVRDKIPARISQSGETVREARLSQSDLGIALSGKLLEELEEYLQASDQPEQAAEIADVLEVLKGIAAASGILWSDVLRLAEEKKESRGGFEEGRVLIETSLPKPDSPLAKESLVTIGNLGQIEFSERDVAIPATSLLSTARGPGVIFSFEGDPKRYRVSVRSGKLRISKLDGSPQEEETRQTSMFKIFGEQ